ncbi:MAG: DUF308 domain-containing protein [Clostridia bacterium]|nr:DUF308 domain-containing protein [Clostridia bacterium]
MKKKKFNLGGSITILFEVLVGILLLIDPIEFTSGIIITAGIIMCAVGIWAVITYFRTDAAQAAAGGALLKGMFLLITGIFCIFKSYWFVASFTFLTTLYGMVMLLSGLAKLQDTVDAIRLKRKRPYLVAVSAIISLTCAVIIIFNPFLTAAALWIFIGIALIVKAVVDIMTMIFGRAKDGE